MLELYAGVLRRDFYNHVRDESTSCVLMNNIQQTRIQLEKTYQAMGGQELEEDAAAVLNQLQAKLCKDLDDLAHVFADSFKVTLLLSLSRPFLLSPFSRFSLPSRTASTSRSSPWASFSSRSRAAATAREEDEAAFCSQSLPF